MNAFQAWQLLLVGLAGWMNRHQQDVIAYIQEENQILKNRLTGKRIRFTDDERRRLAVKGKALGRRVLREVASIGKGLDAHHSTFRVQASASIRRKAAPWGSIEYLDITSVRASHLVLVRRPRIADGLSDQIEPARGLVPVGIRHDKRDGVTTYGELG